MKKNKKPVLNKLILLLCCLIVVAIIGASARLVQGILHLENTDTISIFISAMETVGLLVSLIVAVQQLADSKEIARATFITELNKSYVENEGYTDFYNALQNCRDGICKCDNTCNGENGKCSLEFPKGAVSNYLTFFETMYILHKNGVLSFETIDDLFAYRFFLAVHSEFVQEIKLAAQPFNFINIYRLEKEWLDYIFFYNADDDCYHFACM